MELYVVIGIWNGCLQDVTVHSTIEKARTRLNELLPQYDLTNDDKPDNKHSDECRWNDEKEVHLHPVQLDKV